MLRVESKKIRIISRVTPVSVLVELLDCQRSCVTGMAANVADPLHPHIVTDHGRGRLHNHAHLGKLDLALMLLRLCTLFLAALVEADVSLSIVVQVRPFLI